MCAAGFPEPYTFSLRARNLLAARRHDFDLIHDNQCLGTGLLGMMDDGWPVVATLHHPITVDRDLDMEHATSPWKRATLRRWYAFLEMQMKVAQQIPRLVTVSENSRRDIVAQMGVPEDRLHIVPVGVDQESFRPMPNVAARPRSHHDHRERRRPDEGSRPAARGASRSCASSARTCTSSSSASRRTRARSPRSSTGSGCRTSVEFVSGVPQERIVELYAEAEVAVVPSLYEGFSLPAIEAMACGVPLVATTGGALPEVVGPDGEAALTVPAERPVGAGHRHRPDARRPRAAGPHRRGRPRTGCSTASPGGARPRA